MRAGWIIIPLALLALGWCARSASGDDAEASEPKPIALCGDAGHVEARLQADRGEVPVAAWVQQDGRARVLYANASNDSWTIVIYEGMFGCTAGSGVGVSVLGVRNVD